MFQNRKWLKSGIAAACGLSALACAGQASATVWDFASLSGFVNNSSPGVTQMFTQGSQSVTASALVPGWAVSGGSPALYDKFTSGDAGETGLGLTPNVNKEIFYPNGIGLVASGGGITGVSIGSVQSGESWAVLGCGAGFSSCSTLQSGIGTGPDSVVNVTGLGKFASYVVDVPCANSSSCSGSTTNSGNNIVLMSATTPSVPEPATLSLLALGMGALGFAARRKRTQV